MPLNEGSKKITQILSNDKAMRVLEILTDKPMSATDMAEKLSMPLTTIKYNLDALVEVDLIKVKQTKWSKKGREIKIYEPVQKFIVVAPGSIQKDKSSVISMLKKYLGLVAGAAFAATGLEALARSRGFGIGTTPMGIAADTVYSNTEYVPRMDIHESTSQETPAYEPLTKDGAIPQEDEFMGMGVPEEEFTGIEPTEAATESPAYNQDTGIPDSSALDGYVPEDMESGIVSSVPPEGFDIDSLTGSPVMDSSQLVTDNLSIVSEPASSLIPYDLLSHVSIWFLFGCLFIITLLFVRELYYRKKNI
ncbi:MAG: helix-turn-helix domain-containing protein [Methanolobus sp.]|nr:helix-turn-helix domain-containing protein [Methanolobus sp.]